MAKRDTQPTATSGPTEPVAHVAQLIEAHMTRAKPADVDALVVTLRGLCDALTPDHGAEVVEQAKAVWMERTRKDRLARYCPAEGYGGVW